MNRYTLLAAASLGIAACVGCQHSGHTETTADAQRPAMADAYTTPYTTTTDTPWMHSASDTSAAGTLRAGDTVYLRSDSAMTGTVPAKTSAGKVVYVRATDLRAK